MNVVRSHRLDPGFPCDAHQSVAKGVIAVTAVIEDLDAEAVADRVAPLPRCIDRLRDGTGLGEPGNLAPLTAGQDEESLGTFRDPRHRRAGLAALVAEVS